MKTFILSFFMLMGMSGWAWAAPDTFEQAKIAAKEQIYYDQTQAGTLYCGCQWRWTGRSGGRVDLASCGYEVRSQVARAERLEWEHIVPAYNFGRARQCWQQGGRDHCNATDPVFNAMEADLHNLAPSIGEVNGDRSNYDYGMLPNSPKTYGACPTKVDIRMKVAEPRDEVKGMVARVYFYMFDRYNLRMSRQQQQLLTAWDKQFPVTAWERERDRRVARVMGHSNPFVTGEKSWNTRDSAQTHIAPGTTTERSEAVNTSAPIRGNKNSRIYHLPVGCPSYDKMNPRNAIEFASESDAQAAGYRKASNCT